MRSNVLRRGPYTLVQTTSTGSFRRAAGSEAGAVSMQAGTSSSMVGWVCLAAPASRRAARATYRALSASLGFAEATTNTSFFWVCLEVLVG
jgi:hypothetical protein